MTQITTPTAQTTSPEEALKILTEAWAYYTPRPMLVTEQNSRPSPVFEDYYAA
ncbi:hypothetical protein [Marivita sp.]|jgi:predicted RNase H-like HicB family nuclease|uniref:hypothetical protein n=1 Tax=Marivita sp. TaxID=2003365 RepID=UPI003F725B17